MSTVGFVILRHVNSEETNRYWIHCYECIRKHYPENEIVIIDDNSTYFFITTPHLYKVTIVNSEYPKRGELLPYIYYLKYKWFDVAVMIHDSVFINQEIDFYTDTYKILWDFKHDWDTPYREFYMLQQLDNTEYLTKFFHDKTLWTGCFGSMCCISYNYLKYIDSRHNLSALLNHVTHRDARCDFERVLGCVLQFNYPRIVMFNHIHDWTPWGIKFDEKDKYTHLALTKVWTGR